jgi:RHS repeat-associated protein
VKFTGQRLDTTGLYYYGARYYDPGIGRFISPDSIVPDPTNPQNFNRYSYCLNNPLKYTDPTGHWPSLSTLAKAVIIAAAVALIVAVVIITAPVAITALAAASGAVLGTATLTTGQVAAVSISCGVVAGSSVINANKDADADDNLPAAKTGTYEEENGASDLEPGTYNPKDFEPGKNGKSHKSEKDHTISKSDAKELNKVSPTKKQYTAKQYGDALEELKQTNPEKGAENFNHGHWDYNTGDWIDDSGQRIDNIFDYLH